MVARSRRARGCAIITGSRMQAGRRFWIYREGMFGDGRGGAPDGICTGCSADARDQQPRAQEAGARDGMPLEAIAPASSVELGVTTPFSFLRGASDAIELVLAAFEHGDGRDRGRRPQHAGRGGADAQRGQGRGAAAADRVPDRPGRLRRRLLAYPRDREAYGRLSRMLSLGKMRAAKGECDLSSVRSRAARRGDRADRHAGRGSGRVRGGVAGDGARRCRGCGMSRRRISIAATIWRGSSGSTGMAKAPWLQHPRHQRRPLSRARAAARCRT